jgi:hypothetical protein
VQAKPPQLISAKRSAGTEARQKAIKGEGAAIFADKQIQ